ncbi:LOW QUALITY PROTEIN: membrane-spanning 4-domains subfamily A member 8-like [Myotis lucifugus]|uniref:LOW QUALITY PROTEIN: membrane-spanning 4-domains subfamily A member 8-like n=1 Tax=Myotis lucifugus TaxID=59463 RepID=UPI000CCC3FE1|nr:LOW QUALITY PROTEIN: membrane-spanning 4-domains subfamily A member 8-like [Myotis lucifugus]
MNLMTSAGSTANSAIMMAPHHGYPVNPGSMSQVPQYPLNQPQVHQIPGNQPGLEPPVSMQPAQRSLKEGKVLGAIQILIGLIHIGLGSVIGMVLWYYTAVSFYGGYPFWGGILFIISGSLSVASEQLPRSSCLVKSQMGKINASAIFSMFGIMLFITDMGYNSICGIMSAFDCSTVGSGIVSSAVLFVFSLLEFCIACTSAHFDCKLLSYLHTNRTVVFQTVYVTNPVANSEPVNSPPSYSREIQDFK